MSIYVGLFGYTFLYECGGSGKRNFKLVNSGSFGEAVEEYDNRFSSMYPSYLIIKRTSIL